MAMTRIAAGLAAAVLAIGCGQAVPPTARPEQLTIEERSVDQVFQDHDGIRLWATTPEGEYRQEKFFTSGRTYGGCCRAPLPQLSGFVGLQNSDPAKHVRIFKNLASGEHARAKIVKYTIQPINNIDCSFRNEPLSYVEIYLPPEGKISPGEEVYGGKFAVHEPMHEVR